MAESPTPQRVLDAVKTLQISQSTLEYIGRAHALDAAIIRWREILPDVKATWKRLVMEAHPDRGGSQDAFVAVQTAWELVQDEAFARVVWESYQRAACPPPTLVRVVYTVTFTSTPTGATTAVTDTGFGFYGGDPPFTRKK